MEQRVLGTSGLTVSAIGLGCMGMSEFYGPSDDAQSLETLAAAVDELGITLLDTADMYGSGHNERLLARFLKTHRSKVTLATKFGIRRPDDAPKDSYVRIIDNSPAYIRQACEASLRRLEIDVIDLYYCHRVNPAYPIEDTVGVMADLAREGKIRAIGLSEVNPATLRRAAAVHPIAAVQSEYSLWTRDPENGLLAACRELGVGFVAYSPLGRGFLTGALGALDHLPPGDFRNMMPRMQGEALAANQKLVDATKALADDVGVTPAQLALAWVLAQGKDIVPIPGTRRRAYLEQNVAAAMMTLDAATLARLNALFAPEAVQGSRYPAAGMTLVNT